MRNKGMGFTLVELLVVISIISMLLAITIPSLNKARQYSKRTACKAQLHDIGMALRMYLDNNRNKMPPAVAEPWSVNDATICNGYGIVRFLGPYLSVPSSEITDLTKKCYSKVLCCPGDKYNGVAKYYYKNLESSYAYNQSLGDQMFDRMGFRSRIKEKDREAMGDFDAFHGTKGALGAYNYLFADCHVGDRKGY